MDQIGPWQMQSNILSSGQASFHPDLQAAARERSDPPSDGATVAVVSQAKLTFGPDLRRRTANLQSFVAKSRASDPQGAAAMAKLFASTNVIALLDGELAQQGLSVDNLADAYTVWWIAA